MLTTLKNEYYLGVDAGGNHTEAVITDSSGFVLGRAYQKEGSNLHNAAPYQSYEVIKAVVEVAREDAKIAHPDCDPQKFASVCIGMAGFDTRGDARLITEFVSSLPENDDLFRHGRVTVVNNGLIKLKSGTEKNYGITLESGVGSNCYGLNQKGEEYHTLGWGYFLGDAGSGYAIGRRLVRRAMAEYEGTAVKTGVSAMVLDYLNIKSADELVSWAYRRTQIPITEISSLSELIFDVDAADMMIMKDLILEAGEALVDGYRVVLDTLNLAKLHNLPVVLSGHLLGVDSPLTPYVKRGILDLSPHVDIIMPSRTNAEGAVRLAQMTSHGEVLPRSALSFVASQF